MKLSSRINKILDKFKNMSFVKKNLILIFCCFLLITIATVGYAALNQSLNITGDLALRAVKDIRISDLKLLSTENGGYELYNSKYTVDTISLTSNLLDEGASTTYQATITNYGNVDMEISSISKSVNSWFAECTINGLAKEDVINAGESKTFTIKLKKPVGVVTSSDTAGVLIELGFQEAKTRYLAYSISGNSVQNGTPTPDNPIDVESVGTTKNLFDLEKSISQYTTYTKDSTGILFKTVASMNSTGWVLNSSEQLTVSYYVANVSGTNFRVRFLYSDGTYSESQPSGTAIPSGSEDIENYKQKITTTSTAGKTVTGIKFNWTSTGQFILDQFQIEKGTSSTTYEEAGTYTIPIKASGKNILNKSDSLISGIKNESSFSNWATVAFNNSWVVANLKPSTTYTISYDVACISVPTYTSKYGDNVGFVLYSGVSGYGALNLNTSQYLVKGDTIHIEKTFTTPATLHDASANYRFLVYTNRYLNGSTSVMSTMKFSNIQIEKGSTATSYVPYVKPEIYNIYLDEPLGKVGTTADTINYSNKTITRKVGKYNFTGNESWNENYAPIILANVLSADKKGVSGTSVLSNIALDSGTYKLNYTNVSGQYFGFLNGYDFFNVSDLASFKTKLSTLNAYVYYQLATPISQSITLPEIIKKPYYTEYEIMTDIEPSNFTYNYVVK